MSVHRRAILLAPLLPLLNACETYRQKDQETRLAPSLQGFAATVRWGNLDSAFGFLRPREGTPEPPENFENLKVTGYTIQINSVNETSDEANVTMSFTYYQQDQGRLDTTEQTMIWYFDPESEVWLIDGTRLPEFR